MTSLADKLRAAADRIDPETDGVVILIVNALVIERITRQVASASTATWAPLVAMAVVLFYYPLVFWTLRGMEVGAVALAFDALLLLSLTMEESFSAWAS